MPSLSFFVDEHDVHLLLDRLNADPEIAFIVPDDLPGPESRKADDPSISWTPAFQVHRAGDGKLELKQEHGDPLRWKAVRAE
jgi:hypothetical protein